MGEPDALPWFLKTETRCWASFLVLCLFTSFAQGPIMTFQLLEPIMLNDGAYLCDEDSTTATATDHLNSILSVALGVQAIAMLFLGIFFDAIGPRTLAVCACLISAGAFALLGLTLKSPCDIGSGWLWTFVVVFTSSQVQSFALYSYLYVLPNPFMVSALVNCCYVLADVYGTILGYLHASAPDEPRLSSWAFFYYLGVSTLLSAIVCWLLLPSRQAFAAITRAAIAKQQEKLAGTPLPTSKAATAPDESTPLKDSAISDTNAGAEGECIPCARARALLRDMWALVFDSPVVGWAGCVLLLHIFVLYMQQMVRSPLERPRSDVVLAR